MRTFAAVLGGTFAVALTVVFWVLSIALPVAVIVLVLKLMGVL